MRPLYDKLQLKLLDPKAFEGFDKPLKTITLFNQGFIRSEYHLHLPALLLDYTVNTQDRELQLRAHLLYELPTLSDAPALMDYIDRLRQLITHTESAHTGKLQPVSEYIQNWDIVSTYVLSFEASIKL